jgi:hypothetical protein
LSESKHRAVTFRLQRAFWHKIPFFREASACAETLPEFGHHYASDPWRRNVMNAALQEQFSNVIGSYLEQLSRIQIAA